MDRWSPHGNDGCLKKCGLSGLVPSMTLRRARWDSLALVIRDHHSVLLARVVNKEQP